MFVLIINIIIAAFLGFKMMQAKQAGIDRGTNAVTKFVRDVGANATYNMVAYVSMLATVVCLVLSLLTKFKFIACLPTALVCVLCFVLMHQSNKNAQRVRSARVVTKGTLEVGAQAGGAIGQVAGGAVGFAQGGVVGAKAGMKAGRAIGDSIGNIGGKAAAQMTDVESLGVTKEDVKGIEDLSAQISEQFENPELFMKKAQALGMVHDGDNVIDVASRVIEYAPQAALEQLPQNATLEKQATLLLEGKV